MFVVKFSKLLQLNGASVTNSNDKVIGSGNFNAKLEHRNFASESISERATWHVFILHKWILENMQIIIMNEIHKLSSEFLSS